MIKLIDKASIYYLLIIFLSLLYLVGMFSFGFEAVIKQLIPSLFGAILSGLFIDYIRYKRWRFPVTSIITGLIIGLVAQFGESFWKLLFIGVFASTIKLFVRLSGRHIFNPAAAGLIIGIFVFGSYPSWWVGGNHVWIFLLWLPILLYKLKRWASVVGFLVPTLFFSGPSIILSASMLFFLSIMLIEPKTSPFQIKNGLVYGLVVAISYWIFSNIALPIDTLLAGLLTGNFLGRLSEKFGLI